MSAQPIEKDPTEDLAETDVAHGEETGREPGPDSVVAPTQVEVRRNALVSGVLGLASSAMAIAYLRRAADGGAALDWVLCLLLAVLAALLLRGLLDARTPLLVADEMGVRIRLGAQWRGLPWEAIDRVLVTPRRGLLRDGRIVVGLVHVQRATEGLEGRARRAARLNHKMYGAALAVPVGLTTRVSGEGDLADRVAELSHGRAEVVTLLDEPGPVVTSPNRASSQDERAVISDDTVREADRRPRWLRRSEETGAAPSVTPEGSQDAVGVDDDTAVASGADGGRVGSLEPDETRAGTPAVVAAQPRTRVRTISAVADPVDPLVIGDFEPLPAYDPVIGPELAAARTRVGLSVDELADRTRIRPHVIESIEVDDFVPCGGDFYARGHIRTLARVLGKDPVPMLAHFDARYATAPINARRVFEAELATGMTGSMRSTVGGPNWALLVGVVLTLVLVWSGVRLFAGDSQQVLENAPPMLNGSAGLGGGFGDPAAPRAPRPVTTRLVAVNAGTHVEVRDGDGALVFEGDLVIGEVKTLRVDPPVTVTGDNAGALSVAVNGTDQGVLGELDQPGTRVFQRPAR